MIKENLYKILSLPDFAPMENIKKAYRVLVMKHHPDRGGDVETMKRINAAYQILSEKKAEYDMRLKGGTRPAVVVHYQSYGWTGGTSNGTSGFAWTFVFNQNGKGGYHG